MMTSGSALSRFCAASGDVSSRMLLVAAHPDDETIGAASRLMTLGSALMLVHVTDGAPRRLIEVRRSGYQTARAYAAAREVELRRALAIAGAGRITRWTLGIADQAASFSLLTIIDALVDLMRRHQVEIVVTHPYEGGHPDHDATAFAVQAACALLAPRQRPTRIEFTSYHAGPDGTLRTGTFLPAPAAMTCGIILSLEQQRLKRRMLDAFVSQRETLRPFGTGVELFRLAPEYDFTRPPHAGVLHYERYDWGVGGAAWREAATAAAASLQSRAAIATVGSACL